MMLQFSMLKIYGRMTLSNAAALGSRDVFIETTDDSVITGRVKIGVGIFPMAIGLDFM